jgi:hypothetical protein
VLESKAIMFKSLYVWVAAYNNSRFSSFLEFMDLCSSSLPNLDSLFYTS